MCIRDRAYATGFHRREGKKYPEDAIAEAHRHIENGFKAMKLKAGFGVEKDIVYIRAIREAIGFDVMLMACLLYTSISPSAGL